MAHGWAGFLYATLRWCEAARRPLPRQVEDRLAELAALAQPAGRGLFWPWRMPEVAGDRPGVTAGSCEGNAGHALLSAGTLPLRVLPHS